MRFLIFVFLITQISCGLYLGKVKDREQMSNDLAKKERQLSDCIGKPIETIWELREYKPSPDTVYVSETLSAPVEENDFYVDFNPTIKFPRGQIGLISKNWYKDGIFSEKIAIDWQKTELTDTLKTTIIERVVPDPETEDELIELRAENKTLKDMQESGLVKILKWVALIVVLLGAFYLVTFFKKKG